MEQIIIDIKLTKSGYILYIGTEVKMYKIKCKNRQQLNREIKDFINEYIDYAEQFN